MAPVIRRERRGDEAAIGEVITEAFHGHPFSQGREAAIVARLRRRHALAVGLVADDDKAVVGHAAFSRVLLSESGGGWYALGPLAVRPEHQRQGIGRALFAAGHVELRGLGAAGCVVLGDPIYYAKLGFQPAPALRLQGNPTATLLACLFGTEAPAGDVDFHSAFFESDETF